jgi:type I restriction enzyme, S subunit
MEMVKISSLITDKISGEWGSDALTSNAVNVIRTANFTNSGIITFHNLVKREIERKIVERKKLLNGDIIIEKSGGSPNQPVGRVVYFENPDNSTFLCNNFTSILRPNKGKVNPKYLFYLLMFLKG